MQRKFKIMIAVIVICTFVLIRRIGPRYHDFDYTSIRRKVHCDKTTSADQKYLLFPMTTVIYNAGIGNQLFEVFSLLGIAQTLNRAAIFNLDDLRVQSKLSFLEEKLPEVVEQVGSLPINVAETTRYDYPDACCHYQIPRLMLCEQAKYLLIAGSYFQSYKYFAPIEYSVRKWLKPSQEVEEQLRQLVARKDELRFKTCVHMRRGDFLTDGEHSGSDYTFAINAINHLYTLNPGLVYLFSNDKSWVQKHVADHLSFNESVVIMKTSPKDALLDLYFSQVYCDSVLITAPSSTFGWWMGYLSKNMSNVYYRDIWETNDNVRFQMIEEDFYPSQWKKMRMTQSGRVFISK